MSKAKIFYISGGERSGKSSFGQKLTQEKTNSPIYFATAKVLDKDFEQRVKRHKADRDSSWKTIEEPVQLSKHNLHGKTVMLDCITLWLANIYYENNQKVDKSLEIAKEEWNKFVAQEFELIVISNEMGMGVHAQSVEARKFVELQGWMNQYIASKANEVWFMVSGIPMKIK